MAAKLHAIGQSLEFHLHFIQKDSVTLVDTLSISLGVDILGVNNLLEDGSQGSLNVGVGELGARWRVGDCLLAHIVEGNDNLQHTNSLGKGACEIVLSEGMLGKEILTDKLGNFHDDLLILRKRFFSDELDNLAEVVLLLQNGSGLVSEVRVLGIHVVEEGFQDLHVLGVGNKPVKRWEMLTLGKLLVKTPEDLHNRKGGRSNWIGEITTGRGDSSDDSDGTLTIGRSKTGDTPSTFVEGSKTGTQVGGVTGIGRHLSKTSRNLTKSLGPTGSRVSHHGNIHSLITEVLSKRNPGVNRSLTRGDGHVGGIGNECGTLHDTDFPLSASVLILDSHGQFREITQDFSHLITTFSATDVDNSIRVGKLGKRLRNNSLSATESTRDGTSSSKDRGEKTVNDTKTSNKGLVSGKLLGDGTGATDRPEVAKSELVCFVLGFIEDFHDNIVDKEGLLSVGSSGVDLLHGSVYIRRTENLVAVNELVLSFAKKRIFGERQGYDYSKNTSTTQ